MKEHIDNYIKKPKPKKCKVCKQEGMSYGTRDNGKGSRYYNLTCITCKSRQDRKQSKSWREKLRAEDPERYYRFRRNQQLKRYYKITLDEYEAMLKDQGGGCAICGKLEELKAMPVDHCHSTNKFRGILCHWCNKGLGQFFDNKDTLAKAILYLERSS
jgi:hypothetical protein